MTEPEFLYDEVTEVKALLEDLERRAAACRSFLAARAAGAEVYLFSPDGEAENRARNELRAVEDKPFELPKAVGLERAMAMHPSGSSMSCWDDGRKAEWTGSRCVISN